MVVLILTLVTLLELLVMVEAALVDPVEVVINPEVLVLLILVEAVVELHGQVLVQDMLEALEVLGL